MTILNCADVDAHVALTNAEDGDRHPYSWLPAEDASAKGRAQRAWTRGHPGLTVATGHDAAVAQRASSPS
jgi:hypothetical protein